MALIPLAVPGSPLLPQNIPLALVLMVISSLLFAGGATIQHFAVGRTVDSAAENRSMNLRQVLSLITNWRWLGGIGVAAVGSAIHIVALMLAPVTVVQPVGILAVPWSVLLAARIHHLKPTRQMWGAVAVTIAGIVTFTLISTSTAAPATELPSTGIITGSLVVFAAGGLLAFLGMTGTAAWRCIMWASGGSFYYGLSAALIKVISELAGQPGFLTYWLFWTVVGFMAVCYILGGWMIQQSYANGPAEIVVGSMTTTDPIVAVTFGMAVLGEGARVGMLHALGMLAAGAVAVAGVVILSIHHPASASAPDPEPSSV